MLSQTFASLGCQEPFLSVLTKKGFIDALPVQAGTFEMVMSGRDVLVQSQTGSGKTLAYGLPLLHKPHPASHPKTIVLTPTRELAQQIHNEVKSLKSNLPIALLVGGLSYVPQLKALKGGASFIVGTPGRVLDHLERGTLKLGEIQHIVLDECDEMLNVGFLGDVEKVLTRIKVKPQILLFSATLPLPIKKLANRFLKDPFLFNQNLGANAGSHIDIEHTPIQVEDRQHVPTIINLISMDDPAAALIFCKTKHKSEQVADQLNLAGLSATYLHGDLNQNARNRVLQKFKDRTLRYLVATDVAARGLDINGLPMVIHVGIPNQMENYIHRSGRTGRAGAKGVTVALVNRKESSIIRAWSKRGGFELKWRLVPRATEIIKSKSESILVTIQSKITPELLATAKSLLEKESPENLVAGLLAMTSLGRIQNIPQAPAHEPQEERRRDRDRKPKFDKHRRKESGFSRFNKKKRYN